MPEDDLPAQPVDLRELRLRFPGGLTYEAAFLTLAEARLETSTAALSLWRIPPDTGNALELLHGEIGRRDFLGRCTETHALLLPRTTRARVRPDDAPRRDHCKGARASRRVWRRPATIT